MNAPIIGRNTLGESFQIPEGGYFIYKIGPLRGKIVPTKLMEGEVIGLSHKEGVIERTIWNIILESVEKSAYLREFTS